MRAAELVVSPADWRPTCAELAASGATMLDFLTAVDHPDADQIELVAHFVDVSAKVRHLVRTRLDRSAPLAESLADVFGGAGWHERETHEMFGVEFAGNDDLRPLLTTGGTWPLRRTTPLPRRAATRWPGASDPADRPAQAPEGTGRTGRVAARPRSRLAPPGVHPEWAPAAGADPTDRPSAAPSGGRA